MCKLCSCHPDIFSRNSVTGKLEEFLSGIILVKERRDSLFAKKGMRSLMRKGEHDFSFTIMPRPEPFGEREFRDWERDCIKWADSIEWTPEMGFDYISAAIDKGYDKDGDIFYYWFFDYIGRWIEAHIYKIAY